jgi:hypothetical protein
MNPCLAVNDLCPPEFTHKAPENHSYEFSSFKRNVTAIWLRNHSVFIYTSDPVRTIFGFYNTKTRKYFAPINSKKVGKEVKLSDTTPYTAMQLNLNPLEAAFL